MVVMNNEVFLEDNVDIETLISKQLWKHLETFPLFIVYKLGYYLYDKDSLNWSILIRDFFLAIFGAKYGWWILWFLVHWFGVMYRFGREVTIRDNLLQNQRDFETRFLSQQNRQALLDFERARSIIPPSNSEANDFVPIGSVATFASMPMSLRACPKPKKH
jgi:hypothetical protein